MTALLVHAVLIQAITFVLRPASTYRAIELGADASVLGLIGATFAVVPLVLALPAGALTDRVGERGLMVAGSVITIGASLWFATAARGLVDLVVANALLGVGHLCCVLGQQSLVANSATSTHLDSKFGYYTFAASLGQAVGPAVLAVQGGSSIRPDIVPVFWSAVAMSVVMTAVATCTSGRRRRVRVQDNEPKPVASGTWVLMRTPGLVRALTTSAIILAAVDLTVVYLPALGLQRGLSAAAVGWLLVTRAAFSMLSRLLLGRLSARLGRTRLMASSVVLSAATLALCAVPVPTAALFAVVALLGLGLGIGQPLTMSWLSEQAPPGSRGRAMSLRLVGNRLGQVTVPATLGALAGGASGAPAVFLATSLTVAATTACMRGFSLDS